MKKISMFLVLVLFYGCSDEDPSANKRASEKPDYLVSAVNGMKIIYNDQYLPIKKVSASDTTVVYSELSYNEDNRLTKVNILLGANPVEYNYLYKDGKISEVVQNTTTIAKVTYNDKDQMSTLIFNNGDLISDYTYSDESPNYISVAHTDEGTKKPGPTYEYEDVPNVLSVYSVFDGSTHVLHSARTKGVKRITGAESTTTYTYEYNEQKLPSKIVINYYYDDPSIEDRSQTFNITYN